MGKFWQIVNGKRKRTAAGIKHQHDKWETSAKYKKEHAARNKARRKAIADGRAEKGDGTDVHDHNGKRQVVSSAENRGKREKSRKPGSHRNKARWGK